MGNKKTKDAKSPKGNHDKQQPADTKPPVQKEAKSYKVLLIGDSGVGKSSVLVRYFENKWEEGAVQNLSSELPTTKEVTVDNHKINLLIWDTGGQERFRTITSSFYQGSHGILIVYDLTQQETWANVSRWVMEANRYAPEAAKILVGNKLDLAGSSRVVDKGDVEEYCENCDDKGAMSAFEVSAKNGEGVKEVFKKLAEQIYQMDGAESE